MTRQKASKLSPINVSPSGGIDDNNQSQELERSELVRVARTISQMLASARRARGHRAGAARSRLSQSSSTMAITFATSLFLITVTADFGVVAQKRQRRLPPVAQDDVSLTSHSRESLSPEAREMVDLASAKVCRERISDPKGS